MHIKYFSLLLTVVMLTGGMVVSAQVNFEPYPVSEYTEQTGPNTMTFLSYPKYYKNALGELTLVDTTLMPSKSAEWDYEVSTGIWTLNVRNDGTFQARHKGDIFTYRFENLGIGRGNQFHALDLGKADWSNMMVIGDTVRWNEVFPNVDVTVRYIHDILKVDVKVKEALMNQIRSQVRNGQLNANDYLTARFEIPEVFISSQAKQGGIERDLYAEPISVNQPLEFVKDNKVVHKLRPVESYVLDDAGERILDFENPIRSQQQWRLNRNAPGIAEMSAHLGDLANAPEGDVVIDPSIIFNSATGIYDSILKYQDSTVYGNYSTATWTYSDRLIFGFDIQSLGSGKDIESVGLFIYSLSESIGTDIGSRAYKITESWVESAVNWYYRDIYHYLDWYDVGGTYDANSKSPEIDLPTSNNQWIYYNVTTPFESHYQTSLNDVKNKGFLVKMEDSTGGSLSVCMSEYVYAVSRPILVVNYKHTSFGAHAGNATSTNPDNQERLEGLEQDHLLYVRFFVGGQSANDIESFVLEAIDLNQKIILNFDCNDRSSDVLYAQYVYNIVNALSDYIDGTESRTIIGIELGREEDSHTKWNTDGGGFATPPERYQSGKNYAEYYIEAYDAVHSRWPYLDIIAPSLQNHKVLAFEDHPDYQYGYGQDSRAFLSGFIDAVIEDSSGSIKKLPGVISIDGYVEPGVPEDLHQSDGGRKSWLYRTDHLYDAAKRNANYSPLLAVTEYGFLKNGTFDEKAQAVYYLRRTLMDCTMRTDTDNKFWKYCFYFLHPYDGIHPYFSVLKSDYVSPRAISLIMSTVLNPDSAECPGIGSPNFGVWKSALLTDKFYDTIGGFETLVDGTIQCGWINSRGDNWGAIWRFDSHVDEFVEIDKENRDFYAPGNTESFDAYLYRFSFDVPPTYGTTDFELLNESNPISGNYQYSGEHAENTKYTIPDVTENPYLIKFVSN